MKTARAYLVVVVGLLLLITVLAVAIQPLMPWLIAIAVLLVIYGVLVRD